MLDGGDAGAAGAAGAAGGLGKAAADWAIQKAKELAHRHKQKDLQLVGDQATISDLKEIRSSDEYARYQLFVKDKTLRKYIRMGLLLRKIHDDPAKLAKAKKALDRSGGEMARAVAQCVQLGILPLLEREIESGRAGGLAYRDIEEFLMEAHKFSYFVRTDTEAQSQARQIEIRVSANNPPFFVVAGSGAAASVAQEVHRCIDGGFPSHEAGTLSRRHEFILIYSRL